MADENQSPLNAYTNKAEGQTPDTKIACVVITRPDSHGGQSCIMPVAAFSAEDEFDGADDGDSVVLTLRTMTRQELDDLPEFEGW
jgi:hypothetical protein